MRHSAAYKCGLVRHSAAKCDKVRHFPRVYHESMEMKIGLRLGRCGRFRNSDRITSNYRHVEHVMEKTGDCINV